MPTTTRQLKAEYINCESDTTGSPSPTGVGEAAVPLLRCSMVLMYDSTVSEMPLA